MVAGEHKVSQQEITVKFMSRGLPRGRKPHLFLRQFPGLTPQWGKCRFVFDVDCREYDWLVVYHDIPKDGNFKVQQTLDCPRQKTMLITTEPSTVTVYGSDYLGQFGTIVTFQEPWAMPHPNVRFRPPGLVWYYGYDFERAVYRSYDEISAEPIDKSEDISTVCSSKKGRLTLHSQRVDFTEQLKEDLPELEVFGRGVREMVDKAESLQPYRYHVIVENHVAPHHITEKLPDAFLGYTLPFYHGAPNTAEYYPKESFVPVDINDYPKTLDIIKSIRANNEFEDRLPIINEARRRVLDEHHLFALINQEIIRQNDEIPSASTQGVIMNRRTMRLMRPLAGLRNVVERIYVKGRHLLQR
jgi:hypothetical protein